MRFAITATDRYLGVFKALVERGWKPLKVFTTPVDGRLHRHSEVVDFANQLKIDVQLSRLTEDNLRESIENAWPALEQLGLGSVVRRQPGDARRRLWQVRVLSAR